MIQTRKDKKMATISKDQIKDIMRDIGYNVELKDELVQWVREDNETSLKSLTFEQANKILVSRKLKAHKGEKWANFDKTNTKHRAILSLLYQAQWVTNYKGKEVPDLDRFSAWLQSEKAPVRKPLLQQSQTELSKTIKALEGIVKSVWK